MLWTDFLNIFKYILYIILNMFCSLLKFKRRHKIIVCLLLFTIPWYRSSLTSLFCCDISEHFVLKKWCSKSHNCVFFMLYDLYLKRHGISFDLSGLPLRVKLLSLFTLFKYFTCTHRCFLTWFTLCHSIWH